MSGLLRALNGPEDIGRSSWFWLGAAVVLVALLLLPLYTTEFQASNNAYYLLNIPIALGLSILWGYCGILSFGQVAYFGVAGYAYGVIAGNLADNPWGPLIGSLGGIALCAAVGAAFGYFVFFGRVQSWIVPILTLVLTLLLETFLGQTAGYQWRIGTVQLGGYNGMTGIPSFQLGNFRSKGYSFYYLWLLGVTLVCYLGCRVLVNAHRGRIMLAIREDALRTELLGYDIRLEQLRRLRARSLPRRSIRPAVCAMGQLHHALPGRAAAGGIASHMGRRWRAGPTARRGHRHLHAQLGRRTSCRRPATNMRWSSSGALLVLVMLFFPRGIIATIAEMRRPRRQQAAPVSANEPSA